MRLDKGVAAVAAQVSKLKAEHKLHTLGKDRLAEIDDIMFRYALAHSPVEQDEEGNPCRPFWENPGDEQRFLRFMGLSYDCARARAPYESPRYAAIAVAAQAAVADIDDDDDDPLERLSEIVARYIAARETQRAEDALDVTAKLEEQRRAYAEVDTTEKARGPGAGEAASNPDDDCDGELVATVVSPDCDGPHRVVLAPAEPRSRRADRNERSDHEHQQRADRVAASARRAWR